MSLKDELIAAIKNQQNHFDMNLFVQEGTEGIDPSCETASCMAGWICALRPQKYLELAKDSFKEDYGKIARNIWAQEEPKGGELDFYAERCTVSLEEITREQAINHIQNDGEWDEEITNYDDDYDFA